VFSATAHIQPQNTITAKILHFVWMLHCISIRGTVQPGLFGDQVSNIHEAMEDLKSHNVRIIGEGPKAGAHGKPVVFIHPKDCNGTLVELEQA